LVLRESKQELDDPSLLGHYRNHKWQKTPRKINSSKMRILKDLKCLLTVRVLDNRVGTVPKCAK
jgi:hypothetical protein